MQPSSYNVGYEFFKSCTHPRLMGGGGGRKRGTNFNIDIYRELFKNRLLKTAICEFIIQAPLKIVDSYVIKK